MPVFDTPEPIAATIDLNLGKVRIVASERTDTVVDVRPADSSDPRDVATAERARIAYEDGELRVSAPAALGVPRGGGAVHIDIALPVGSRLHASALAADIHCRGRVGECRLTTDCGHIHLDETGPLHLRSVLGNVSVERAFGDIEAFAECGDVRIRVVDGSAQINRTTGDTRIGEATGRVHVYADRGDLYIGRAHGAVEARASQGDIRIDETVLGPLVLETASGRLEVGIAAGVAARLDLNSHVGTVYRSLNFLDGLKTAPGDEESDDAVQVHAYTIIGDIVVRQASFDCEEGWP
ncbi:DUF4097 family beta strand repeat-containing protein [Streptomyces sp. ALB3]|uniref:DUF4097 family beta strand repeat-containing protein n=1 Tax=Streptomyces sp. ALB3 TaxID=3374278 RepID=UPI0037B57217